MDLRLLAKTVGGLMIVVGIIVLAPGIYALAAGLPSSLVFFEAAALSIILGTLLYYFHRHYKEEINIRTGFAVVTFSWLSAALIGAIPYVLSGTLPNPADAFFESTSGFTGTGSSVLINIEVVDPAVLLWRSMTQWLGGMGIIVFFIAILPILGVGGVQLFRAEAPGPEADKITPRVRETAKKLWLIYLSFTAALVLSLWYCGMSLYDAVNHAMTCLSTGGFSTKNAGIHHFNSAAIDYVLIFFMTLSSINFSLHYRIFAKRDFKVFRNTELVWYLGILLLACVLMTATTWGTYYDSFWDAFRKSLFTASATVSSTGYTNADYALWPVPTHFTIIMLMIIGGMSGSTAGGIKVVRIVAALKQLNLQLKHIIHPNAVLTVKVNNHSLRPSLTNAIWGFIFLYFFVFAVATSFLVYDGLSIISASTAIFSALSNIGPALGSLGPTSNYAALSDPAKLLTAFCMVVGRLEFFTVLVLFTRSYWRP